MASSEFESLRGPLPGRLILLVTAYAPVVVLVGLRATPCPAGWVAVVAGVLGIVVWIAFLLWLPNRQAEEAIVEDLEFVDAEVTGYVVSLLLPVVAASNPTTGDWVAYVVCAALILIVAFYASLWSVNPVTYALGLRAARATVDGKPGTVVLVRGDPGVRNKKIVISRVGVLLVHGDAPKVS